MNQTTSTTDTYNAIVELLQSLPTINDSLGQQSFIRTARVDERLFKQIQFGGATAQFFQLLVPALAEYGTLEDGRDPLVAVLETVQKNYVGKEKRETCGQLIQQVQALHAAANQAAAQKQALRERVSQLQQQLPPRMKDLKILYLPVGSRLKKMLRDGVSDEDELVLEMIQQFLANELSPAEFAEMWQAGLSVPIQSEAIKYDVLAKRLQQGELIPVLGSQLHHSEELVLALAKEARYDEFSGALPMISQYYEAEYSRGLLLQTVRNVVAPGADAPPAHPLYRLLANIRTHLVIISDSYDDLLEAEFTNANKPFVVLSHVRLGTTLGNVALKYWNKAASEEPCLPEALSPLELLKNYSMIYKICGGLPDSQEALDSLMISEKDYFAFARQSEKLVPSYIAKQIGRRNLLFLGNPLRDWQDRLIVSVILEKNRAVNSERSYAVQEAPTPFESAYWKSHNVELYQVGLQAFVENIAAKMSA